MNSERKAEEPKRKDDDLGTSHHEICLLADGEKSNRQLSKISSQLSSRFMGESDNWLKSTMLANEAVLEERFDLTENMEKRCEEVVPTKTENQLGNVSVHEERVDLTENVEKKNEDGVSPNIEAYSSATEKHEDGEFTEAPDADVNLETSRGAAPDSKFFAGRSVTPIELQKVMVFESCDCPVVKDICVDDGFHLSEKILSENIKIAENLTSGSVTSRTNVNNDPVRKMEDDALLASADLKFTSIDEIHPAKDQNLPWGTFRTDEIVEESDEITSNISGKITLKQLFTLGELDAGTHCISDHKQMIELKKMEQVTLGKDHAVDLPIDTSAKCEASMNLVYHIGVMSKTNSGKMFFPAASMPIDDKCSNHKNENSEDPPNGHMEGVSSKFKPGAAAATAAAVCISEEYGASAYDLLSVSDGTISDSATSSHQRSYFDNNHGDLNLYGPSLSGPKVTSGHIAYSGSISLRSDSSTTSTRSFAFPVLHREWNTSPVKMAKAERRRSSRKRWWSSLICCRT